MIGGRGVRAGVGVVLGEYAWAGVGAFFLHIGCGKLATAGCGAEAVCAVGGGRVCGGAGVPGDWVCMGAWAFLLHLSAAWGYAANA